MRRIMGIFSRLQCFSQGTTVCWKLQPMYMERSTPSPPSLLHFICISLACIVTWYLYTLVPASSPLVRTLVFTNTFPFYIPLWYSNGSTVSTALPFSLYDKLLCSSTLGHLFPTQLTKYIKPQNLLAARSCISLRPLPLSNRKLLWFTLSCGR